MPQELKKEPCINLEGWDGGGADGKEFQKVRGYIDTMKDQC